VSECATILDDTWGG